MALPFAVLGDIQFEKRSFYIYIVSLYIVYKLCESLNAHCPWKNFGVGKDLNKSERFPTLNKFYSPNFYLTGSPTVAPAYVTP